MSRRFSCWKICNAGASAMPPIVNIEKIPLAYATDGAHSGIPRSRHARSPTRRNAGTPPYAYPPTYLSARPWGPAIFRENTRFQKLDFPHFSSNNFQNPSIMTGLQLCVDWWHFEELFCWWWSLTQKVASNFSSLLLHKGGSKFWKKSSDYETLALYP